jgi:hypothetical protein
MWAKPARHGKAMMVAKRPRHPGFARTSSGKRGGGREQIVNLFKIIMEMVEIFIEM